MECQNIEWSSTRREPLHWLRYYNYIQDWSQIVLESGIGQVFQTSTPKSKMNLEIHRNNHNYNGFWRWNLTWSWNPQKRSQMKMLFQLETRYYSDNIQIYKIKVMCLEKMIKLILKMLISSSEDDAGLSPFSKLVQLKEFRIVTAVIVWN